MLGIEISGFRYDENRMKPKSDSQIQNIIQAICPLTKNQFIQHSW